MTADLTLWTRPRPVTLEGRFRAWLRTDNGLAVYLEVRDRALNLRRAGIEHYGIAAIFESARFDRVRLGLDAEGFRLNNSYRSRLARQLMDDYPELDDFFETRGLRS